MPPLLRPQGPATNRPPVRGGPYALAELIGEGGCARVYRAVDLGKQHQPTVAVKTPLSTGANSELHLRMLERESRLLSRLRHDNIVRMIDCGYQDESYLMVMEYVRGVSISRMMGVLDERCARMPQPIALHLALRILEALEYIHSLPDEHGAGLVHRDVSPGNVLVSFRGAVKLIDFGIARSTSKINATPGRLNGKIGYLSPEQGRGEHVDQRSDLFSFGVVLAEMLLQCRFFPGRDAFDTLRMVLRADLGTLDRARDRLPFELRIILATALSADPDGRFQSAGEMHGALMDFAKHQGLELPDRRGVARWLQANGFVPARSGMFEVPEAERPVVDRSRRTI